MLFERTFQCACLLGCNLVLDGDVRPPTSIVLRSQQTMEILGKRSPDAVEIHGNDPERDASA